MSNLIKIIKNGIIMSIEEKYLSNYIAKGWVEYKGDKEPVGIFEENDSYE